MNYTGYKELECYIKIRGLRIFISGLVKQFTAQEKFLLSAQIIDCSRSVLRNIAEGYGRYIFSDTRNFFIISRGLVMETMKQSATTLDGNYITHEELTNSEQKCELVFKLINGNIAYLDKSKKQMLQQSNPNPNS